MNMEKSTIELLTEYNIDPKNTAIRQYYDADNLWRTLHIERDENKHSAFLAWLLSHDAEGTNSPLIMLLNLLVMRSVDGQMDEHLKMAILKAGLMIKSASVNTEVAVSRLSALNSNDRLDIYAVCDVEGVEDFARLEIIIENKGVVFSVTRDNCNVIKYVQIQDKKDIPTIQGSKYVQADTKGIFARIKEALDGNKLVLFSGTPCHVAALKLFLHKDYEKLFTISVICHGVPSQKMFLDYIDYLERKHKGKLIDINFRDKEKNGWSITLSYTIERRKKKKYFVSNKLSPYFIGFLKGMIVRESCHNCLFAGLNHESDIMLGDFWGFKERYAHLKSFFGFSIFSVNTEIGSRIMSMIKMNMEYGPVDTDDVFDSLNTNLKHSTIMDDNYYLLMDDY